MITDPLLPLHPGIATQPQHVVVGKTRTAKRLSKDGLLFGSRVEPEPVGAFDFHASHSINISCEIKPTPYLPALNGGGFSE